MLLKPIVLRMLRLSTLPTPPSTGKRDFRVPVLKLKNETNWDWKSGVPP